MATFEEENAQLQARWQIEAHEATEGLPELGGLTYVEMETHNLYLKEDPSAYYVKARVYRSLNGTLDWWFDTMYTKPDNGVTVELHR